ncbi:hypothetical protein SAMN05216418_3371 [Microbacterium enclense]|uniref:Uncharacterized protein n=1 Tax=Microbacterium enclense TaxID=993073 RepID=A0A1G6QUH6_9MICO|nr:hypothetical protein SAMN05216418_3371 [Microbacterium enclense]
MLARPSAAPRTTPADRRRSRREPAARTETAGVVRPWSDTGPPWDTTQEHGDRRRPQPQETRRPGPPRRAQLLQTVPQQPETAARTETAGVVRPWSDTGPPWDTTQEHGDRRRPQPQESRRPGPPLRAQLLQTVTTTARNGRRRENRRSPAPGTAAQPHPGHNAGARRPTPPSAAGNPAPRPAATRTTPANCHRSRRLPADRAGAAGVVRPWSATGKPAHNAGARRPTPPSVAGNTAPRPAAPRTTPANRHHSSPKRPTAPHPQELCASQRGTAPRPHTAPQAPRTPTAARRHGRTARPHGTAATTPHRVDSESRTPRGGRRQARRNAAFSDSGASACSTASMLAPMTAAFSAAADCTIDRYSVASGVERV